MEKWQKWVDERIAAVEEVLDDVERELSPEKRVLRAEGALYAYQTMRTHLKEKGEATEQLGEKVR